jgi:branched-chain amino acid transport system substrate-binding protein
VATGAALALLSACGGTSSTAAGSAGGSDAVKITLLADETGPAAVYGKKIADAAKFSVDHFNAEGGLNGRTIDLDVEDTGSSVSTATSLMSKAVSGGTDAVVFGVLSEEALAIGPIAQQAGVPVVNIQAGGPGITAPGSDVWRITPPQPLFLPTMAKYLADAKSVKSAAIFYSSDNSTNAELAKDAPADLKNEGISTTNTVSTTTSETDLTADVTKLLSGNPDAVLIYSVGSQNGTLITQLRRAGYTGVIAGGTPFGAGFLSSLPANLSNGILYWGAYVGSSDLKYKTGRDFLADYEKATGQQPDTFAAETYDAVGLIVAGLKKSGDASPSGINTGMTDVANTGLTGALGDPLTFQDRSAVSKGVIIQWQDGKETLAPGQ